MNYVIFGIHLLVSLAVLSVSIFCVGCLVALDVPVRKEAPLILIGGIVLIPVSILFLILEWHAAIHKQITCLLILGIFFLIVAGLAIVGFGINAFLTIFGGHQPDIEPLVVGSLIFGTLFTYSFPIGLYRVWLSKKWKAAKKPVLAEIVSIAEESKGNELKVSGTLFGA